VRNETKEAKLVPVLALLAPAKTLDFSAPEVSVRASRPVFEADAVEISAAVAALPLGKARRAMKLSAARAKEVQRAARAFDPDAPGGLAAALAFAGEVYRGLRARELSAADLAWAHDRVAILSGLYGLLRPLDRVHPHRLEMSARIPTPRGHNLYAHWGDRITRAIDRTVEGHADPSVIDLASDENTKVIWPRSLAAPWVEVIFESWKDAARTPNVVPTHSRRARGAMARFVIERRCESVDDLRGFDSDGYRLVPERSTARRLVFGRPFGDG